MSSDVRTYDTIQSGVSAGLCTGMAIILDIVLDTAGLRRYFQVIVDGRQVRNPKPDPEIYLRTAERLRIPACDCIVFEDSFPGLEAARNAGMRTVGLKTTHTELPDADLA